jgi:hypothetical protein
MIPNLKSGHIAQGRIVRGTKNTRDRKYQTQCTVYNANIPISYEGTVSARFCPTLLNVRYQTNLCTDTAHTAKSFFICSQRVTTLLYIITVVCNIQIELNWFSVSLIKLFCVLYSV